ncbi:hypothetical protein J4E85_007812 [Alternaria conjuncta]|uniref:uncharacterized protein n=1 Tax=Alternaria conjuncta TaxID=181017 RepID=UPI00221FF6A8|nr:uncharacterized protein J4E85_007812 [Alternaria conjuncta]KAI4924695.1 hypothetical protein J4E85_007812 [Alternaria conjuncta]
MPDLDTLPPEILFTILSYTEPNLNPTLSTYPLNTLATTNKHLNAIVEEYARNLLKRHADIVLPKNTRIYTCRRKWLGDMCYFCKKKTQRKACLYKSVACCLACDKKEYEKMTMTQAMTSTQLSKLDLFTPSPLHLDLPPLVTAPYPIMGAACIMLSAPDVSTRAAHVRSRLGDAAQDESYMRNRRAKHDRIVKHLGITYEPTVGWYMCSDASRNGDGDREEKEKKKTPGSKKKKKERECESRLARWKGEVMAEGAMRALVA